MMRPTACPGAARTAAAVLLTLLIGPLTAYAGPARWTFSGTAGYVPESSSGFGAGHLASFSAARSIGSRWSVFARGSYLRYGGSAAVVAPAASVIDPRLTIAAPSSWRAEFIPMAVGIRFYATPVEQSPRGLFFEAAPAHYWYRWSEGDRSTSGLVAGYEVGGGFNIPVRGGTALEFGMTYMRSGRTWTVGYPGLPISPAGRLGEALNAHDGLSEFCAHTGFSVRL